MTQPESTQSWQRLQKLSAEAKTMSLPEAFKLDADRAQRFSYSMGEIFFDLSKNLITREIFDDLLELARECGLEKRREQLFAGSRINLTEGRSVFHMALRNLTDSARTIDGEDVMPAIRAVRAQMRSFVESLHNHSLKGINGDPFTDVVNIGIGGSDLGPNMVTEALSPHAAGSIQCHFVSNVDASQINSVLSKLDPSTTLFIIASKTFTTQETMTNAHIARKWIIDAHRTTEAVADHFVAVSTNVVAVQEFGIPEEHMFRFWDWVGGRYSLWGAIGLPIACSIGMDGFDALLRGAQAADDHFQDTPLADNIPVILGLLQVWYATFMGAASTAVLPYDQRLARLPAYLQQADMESNGKSTSIDGEPLSFPTGPVVWGEPGTNGQHAFYQLLHQGNRLIPAEFLAAATPAHAEVESHRILLSNFFAQPEALMNGQSIEDAHAALLAEGQSDDQAAMLAPHKVFTGNRPTTSILFRDLDPYTLGQLIATYEHRIFVAGVIWNINSFDQWGVELGKQLAKRILPELADEAAAGKHDASTSSLIAQYLKIR